MKKKWYSFVQSCQGGNLRALIMIELKNEVVDPLGHWPSDNFALDNMFSHQNQQLCWSYSHPV